MAAVPRRWRGDEFAAIPRDMFWFTAIALLGETCALIGDAEQAAGALPAAGAARATARAGHARPRTSAPPTASSRCSRAAAGDLGAAEHHFEAALERQRGCGLRPVVALMRREYAELLLARAATATARAPRRCCARRCARPRRAGCRS